MATFKHVGIVDYEIPGDGTGPAQVIAPDATVDADTNPNGLYFEWESGEPPAGAGDFNDPDYPPEPEPEPGPEIAAPPSPAQPAPSEGSE